MKLLIGLGNPGKEYQNTRHNIGEKIISLWAKENHFPPFKLNKKTQSLVTKGFFKDEEIVLALPQTFMNNSGLAISTLKKIYNVSPNDIYIFHDELDIPLGEIKISVNKSSAGHKGVQSAIDHLKTNEFVRFRIGIKSETNKKTEDYVLEKFTSLEQKILNELAKKIFSSLEIAIKDGPNKAMTAIN